MSNVLLLKIAPPMQSWGVGEKFVKNRKTGRFPTKSGIVGILAAALGWDRDHDLAKLAGLRMGVRVDSKGVLDYDFQTTAIKRGGASKLSYRWFLADAVFIVGLQSDDIGLLERLRSALLSPVYPIFAGRKSFPLNFDMVQGIMPDTTIEEVFSSFPWQGVDGKAPERLETVIDANGDEDNVMIVSDYPVSFAFDSRSWGGRAVSRYWIPSRVASSDDADGDGRSDGSSSRSAGDDGYEVDSMDFIDVGEEVSQ